jgi:hypothetical protein
MNRRKFLILLGLSKFVSFFPKEIPAISNIGYSEELLQLDPKFAVETTIWFQPDVINIDDLYQMLDIKSCPTT